MTILTVDLVQPATGNKYHTLQAAIDAPADGIAPSARSPLTVQGMAAYAGVMTTFTGTSGDDWADAANGILSAGVTGGTDSELKDEIGDSFNALAGNDVISAGAGNDAIDGGDGNDMIEGGSGADTIIGGAGADTITGGSGADTITFDGSDFSIAGGAGTDTLIVTGAVAINLNSSLDQASLDMVVVTGFENVNASTSSATVSIAGDANANVLTGGSYADEIAGGAGDDALFGGDGNDMIEGGAGADIIIGGAGSDSIDGSDGDDTITFDGSDDTIDGGAGTDTLIVTGAATINLLAGNISGFEIVDASNSSVAVSLTGDANANVLTGGSGADTITGGDGDDTITGGSGSGADTITGGAGTDAIVLTNATTVDFTTGSVSGVETLTGSVSGDTVTMTADQWTGFTNRIDLGGGNDTFTIKLSGDGFSTSHTIFGVETVNIIGTELNDTLVFTGAQLDAILSGTLSNSIDLGVSKDRIYLTSTSAKLNALSATDTSIQGVEGISFEGAETGATINIDLSAQSEGFTVVGSTNADTITGGKGDDVLYGGEGGDTISGGGGADVLYGGDGSDTITGGDGNDRIKLDYNNFVEGESIDGGAGTDAIELIDATTVDFSKGTVSGVETLTGSGSSDTVTVSALQWAGFTTINLGDGTDVLNIKASGDISGLSVPASIVGIETVNLTGTTGSDKLTGAQLNAILQGDGTINLGAGADTIKLTSTSTDLINALSNASLSNVETISASGVTGAVEINLSAQTEAFTITGGAGADTIAGGAGADTITGGTGEAGSRLYGATGDDKITGGNGADRISGGAGADTIAGGNGADRIDGGAGADAVNGGAGDDTVSGGAGADMLSGGAGNDVYVVDNTGDKVIESVSGGLDGIQSSITFSLVSVGTVETLTLTGSGSIKGTGNAYNNKLTGNTGANTLDGGAGNDMLNGGVGKDTLTGGAGKDTFFFNAALSAANSDKISDFSVADDTVRMENAVFAALKATGTLAESAFYAGAAAHDASDRIIYNKATGALSYDADGKGGTAAVQFATLGSGLALTHADFMVV